MLVLLLAFLSACCRKDEAPTWTLPDVVELVQGEGAEIPLSELISDDDDLSDLSVDTEATEGVLAWIEDDALQLQAEPDYLGDVVVNLTATDGCDNASTVDLSVAVGDGTDPSQSCETTLSYVAQGSPDGVGIAGTFNDWDPSANLATDNGDGTWSVTLDLPAGAWPYKWVETDAGFFEDDTHWACDPAAPLIHCDAGYTSPYQTSWSQDCGLDGGSCNSLLVVEECDVPRLSVQLVDLDRESGTLHAVACAGGDVQGTHAELDGVSLSGTYDDASGCFDLSVESLDVGRHLVRFAVDNPSGSDEVSIPFWTDDFDWRQAVVYFAFVDRLANGDTSLDGSEGATAPTGDYLGGDWQGLLEALPYLEDLGITVLWITNPQDNAQGDWAGDCDATYTGYHGYWPVSATEPEEHFGDEALLGQLVAEAHDRGIRVIMDWVGNHVHQDHPYYADHPDWFNPLAVCDDYSNWDDIPETCWFASYLPDVNYYEPEPLNVMVEDAIWWAQQYDLDGFRVDAVKHMPHSVWWNLSSRVDEEFEHSAAGGDFDFWLIGETFDGSDRISAYLGPDQLDGQFDFPLFWTLQGAFAYESTDLGALVSTARDLESTWGDATMSAFLGNHDVARFATVAAGQEGYICDGAPVLVADPPEDADVYDRMILAWAFLFTRHSAPLVYYGDELGLPGQNDPDNRQPLWWHGQLGSTVDDLAATVGSDQARVLSAVAALANARALHPAFYGGTESEWWRAPYDSPTLYAYARATGDDAVLVVLNMSWETHELSNGLAYAGLPEGTWVDVLTGETWASSGDNLTFGIGGRSARVLVPR